MINFHNIQTIQLFKSMKNLILLIIFVFSASQVRAQSTNIDAKKQYEIGMDFYTGTKTITKNLEEAVKWFTLSAEQGYDKAQDILGYCYWNGTGVEKKDYAKAAKWYEKAAEQGNSNAQRNISICYRYGYGVTQDIKKGAEWLKKSAENNCHAAYDYASLLLSGTGVEKDTIAALDYLLDSACGGSLYHVNEKDAHKPAKELLMSFETVVTEYKYHVFDCIAIYYERKDECVKAEEYYKRAIDLGSLDARARLAIMYFYAEVTLHGLGIESSYMDEKAAKEFSKGWKRESRYSITGLLEEMVNWGHGAWQYGSMPYSLYEFLVYSYESGIDTPKYFPKDIDSAPPAAAYNSTSISKIVRIANIAAKDENYDGIWGTVSQLLWLENCYTSENCDSKSDNLIFDTYQTICKKTDGGEIDDEVKEFLALGLGRCYYKGRGTVQNEQLAKKYISEAAELGSAEAMRLLSVFYRYGRCGFPRNAAKEQEWHQKALAAGSDQAQKLEELRQRQN